MRISAKGRYALASLVEMACRTKDDSTHSVLELANSLGISKIYLEQVFAPLKKAGIILSIKGAHGGYRLTRSPSQISVWEILCTQETSLIEQTESTVEQSAPAIEITLQEDVFLPLHQTIRQYLEGISLQNLIDATQKQFDAQSFMLNM